MKGRTEAKIIQEHRIPINFYRLTFIGCIKTKPKNFVKNYNKIEDIVTIFFAMSEI